MQPDSQKLIKRKCIKLSLFLHDFEIYCEANIEILDRYPMSWTIFSSFVCIAAISFIGCEQNCKRRGRAFPITVITGKPYSLVMSFLYHVKRKKLICQTAIKLDNRKVHKILWLYEL